MKLKDIVHTLQTGDYIRVNIGNPVACEHEGLIISIVADKSGSIVSTNGNNLYPDDEILWAFKKKK